MSVVLISYGCKSEVNKVQHAVFSTWMKPFGKNGIQITLQLEARKRGIYYMGSQKNIKPPAVAFTSLGNFQYSHQQRHLSLTPKLLTLASLVSSEDETLIFLYANFSLYGCENWTFNEAHTASLIL